MGSLNKKTVVITVSSIPRRQQMMQKIYRSLTKEPSTQFTVVKDQINRIQIFHIVKPDIKVLIRTYTVIVIPIIVNLDSLNGMHGCVNFQLNETINELQALVNKLISLQGERVMVQKNSDKDFKALLTSLS